MIRPNERPRRAGSAEDARRAAAVSEWTLAVEAAQEAETERARQELLLLVDVEHAHLELTGELLTAEQEDEAIGFLPLLALGVASIEDVLAHVVDGGRVAPIRRIP